jgi:predicted ester cyclase
MAQDNMDLMRGIYEVIETGEVDRPDELIAEELVEHEDPPPPGAPSGREGFKEFVQRMRAGFRDLRCRIEDMAADDDKVSARAILYGTHEGEFGGVQPTGNRVEFEIVDIARFENGKLSSTGA